MLAAAFVLLIGACSQPQVGGKVFLPVGANQFKPAGLIQVLLMSGDLRPLLQKMAAEWDRKIATEVAKEILPNLRRERWEVAADLAAARAALVELQDVATGDERPGACVEKTEAAVARARQGYDQLVQRLKPELAAVHVLADSPEGAIPALEAVLANKLDQEAQRLQLDYSQNRISSKSFVESQAGAGGSGKTGSAKTWDRLCWQITNSGHLNLTRADLYFTYNQQRLPLDVAANFWNLPQTLAGITFSLRNSAGEELRGLPAGQVTSMCFYARQPNLGPDQQAASEPFGLSNLSSSRSGAWAVGAENLVLTDAPAVRVQSRTSAAYWQFPPRSLVEAWRRDLLGYQQRQPEAGLVAKLTVSEDVLGYRRADEARVACHSLTESQARLEAADGAIVALEKGDIQNPVARAQLNAAVARVKQERRTEIIPKMLEAVYHARVAGTETSVDGVFTFEDVAPGDYTLLSTNKTPQGASVTWMVPIKVADTVNQDLTAKVMQDGDLAQVIETLILPPTEADETGAKKQPPIREANAPGPRPADQKEPQG